MGDHKGERLTRKHRHQSDRKTPGARRRARKSKLPLVASTLITVSVITAGIAITGSSLMNEASIASTPGPVEPTAIVATEDPAAPVQPNYEPPMVAHEDESNVTGVNMIASVDDADIPEEIMYSYQKVEQVFDQAAPACHLPWELIAAVGKVASNHGVVENSALNETGTMEPAYVLKAKGPKLKDTDGGFIDGTKKRDWPVGPFLILPSTWATIGVDGDSDGIRNPQTLEDSALATGVFLCSHKKDLRNEKVRKNILKKWVNGENIVDAIEKVFKQYANTDFTPEVEAPIVIQTKPIVPPSPSDETKPADNPGPKNGPKNDNNVLTAEPTEIKKCPKGYEKKNNKCVKIPTSNPPANDPTDSPSPSPSLPPIPDPTLPADRIGLVNSQRIVS